MRFLLVLPVLALAGCVSDSTARSNIAKISDADLVTFSANANSPLVVASKPSYRQMALEEMKRRGLVGPGKDGKPTE